MRETYPPLIVLSGPTASGKSALAVELCEAISGEILTADSRQVYRYMDIGTDKPTNEARERVPHHLIDLVNPDEAFTLANYQDLAYKKIDEVLSRGRVPVLAGGTPLYINAVREGWVIPRVEPNFAVRLQLEKEAAESGHERLHARLSELDPAAAAKILPTNTRRVIRALEVITVTGDMISKQQERSAPPFRIFTVILECNRKALFSRIDERVDEMFRRGLVDEVRGLHERGYSFSLPSMSGLGYRQVGEYLQGRASLEEARQRVKWDTHRFVRNQENWLKRITEAFRADVTEPDFAERVQAAVKSFLERGEDC